jgi:hypothetical protein
MGASQIPQVTLTDVNGNPVTVTGGALSTSGGGGGGGAMTVADGADVAQGTTTDAEATGNGTIVAILKRLRTLIAGGLPAALAANGGLKVEGVAGGVAQPISGTVTATVSGTVTTTGPLTDTQLRATAVPVSGTVAATQSTSPWVTESKTYAPTTGEFAPSTSATVFPTLTAKLVRLKARTANAGNVWVGDASDTTAGDGTTDVTSGFQLAPGDDSGWLPVANLNVFFGKGDNAADSVTYMVLA